MKRINKVLVSVFVLVCAGQTAAYAALADDDGLVAGGGDLVDADSGLVAGGGAYGNGGNGGGLVAGGGGSNGLLAGGSSYSGGGNAVVSGSSGLVAGGGSYNGGGGGNLIASTGGIVAGDGLVSGDSGMQLRTNGLTGTQTEFADEVRQPPRFEEPLDAADNEAVATLLPRNYTNRINNLANIEVVLRLIGNGLEILGLTFGVPAIISGAMHFSGTHGDTLKKILTGLLAVIGGLATPGLINWLTCSSRDANLFS